MYFDKEERKWDRERDDKSDGWQKHLPTSVKMLHEAARSKICLGCFRKCSKNLHSAQPLTLQRVNDHLIQSFDINDSRVPIGFCEPCRIRLQEIATKKDAKPFDLTHLHSYLAEQSRTSPRKQPCTCLICRLASSNGIAAIKLLKAYKKSLDRPLNEPQKPIHRLCGSCHSPLFSGCTHTCNNTTLANNILNNVPEGVLDQIASRHLKNKAENAKSKEIFLKTYGTPLPETIGHAKTEPVQFSHKQLDHMQARGDLSGSQMLKR